MCSGLYALPFLALCQPALAGNGGYWHFGQSYGPAGPLCHAEVTQGPVRLGIFAQPGGTIAAFIHGINLPEARFATWQVQGYQWQRLTGGKDALSGSLVFGGVGPHLLGEIAAGNRLDVYVHASGLSGNAPLIGTFDISLAGSARALARFERCYHAGWHASADEYYGYWK